MFSVRKEALALLGGPGRTEEKTGKGRKKKTVIIFRGGTVRGGLGCKPRRGPGTENVRGRPSFGRLRSEPPRWTGEGRGDGGEF